MKASAIKKMIYGICVLFVLTAAVPGQVPEGTLLWNTFLGSAGDEYQDLSGSIVDSAGNAYVIGTSWSAWGSPVRPYTGLTDAFVVKLDPDGNMVWLSFLGGGSSDYLYGIALDDTGNVYVTGASYGPWGSPQRAFSGGTDAFAAKLDPDGNLLWNTFLGGIQADYGSGIALDGSGNVCISGSSGGSWGFPVRAHSGMDDAFAAKLDPDGNLLWNTFLGGGHFDISYGITVDDSGSVYVTGISYGSWGSPIRPYMDLMDAFAVKLDSDGGILWNTFLGGDYTDIGYAISAEGSGHVYISGSSAGPWGSPQRAISGATDAFAAKLGPDGNLLWNTFLGGIQQDTCYDIAIDDSGRVYVAGESYGSWGSPVRAYTGNYDGFAAGLDNSGNLLWNTFLGGTGSDSARGIDVNGSGDVVVSGITILSGWGSPVRAYSGSWDVFAARLKGADPVIVQYKVRVTVSGAGGHVDRAVHTVEDGRNAVIHIFPDEGYEIGKIVDNGIDMPVSNPYVIREIGEDHRVEISFRKILYPPALDLTGVRMTEKAWIVEKCYSDLSVSITESEAPMPVSAYILLKNTGGIWTEITRFTGPGNYTYSDKYFDRDESVSYKLTAMSPEGKIIAETPVLTL